MKTHNDYFRKCACLFHTKKEQARGPEWQEIGAGREPFQFFFFLPEHGSKNKPLLKIIDFKVLCGFMFFDLAGNGIARGIGLKLLEHAAYLHTWCVMYMYMNECMYVS